MMARLMLISLLTVVYGYKRYEVNLQAGGWVTGLAQHPQVRALPCKPSTPRLLSITVALLVEQDRNGPH
jgi:hypothetical protein